ncbi:MAG: ABC-F type ribosomal protection protein [Peptococcaceae bacterium]|nr:ABC-F type ribosomal protection protein [Peptococcaceae bacterium]
MLILHAQNIVKSYGERLLFKIDDLKIYDQDRIGLVGINGCGKSTLMGILAQEIHPDEGKVELRTSLSYMKQLDIQDYDARSKTSYLSGGELSRLKLFTALEKNCGLLLADEPTTSMDLNGIQLVEEKLASFPGALLLISHDRTLLDRLCTTIMEIDNGQFHIYSGNYAEYKKIKELERINAYKEYSEYQAERERLVSRIQERRQNVKQLRKTPKRMGNSEARLHKRSTGEIQKKLHQSVNSLETRLEKLEVKEKPVSEPEIRIYFQTCMKITGKSALKVHELTLRTRNKLLLNKSDFHLPTGSKTALLGENGTGKTTLLKALFSGDPAVTFANGLIPGYFSQKLDILDKEKTILQNVREKSLLSEAGIRIILSRLNFKGDSVHKNIGLLSGGEIVKATLAKILAEGPNLLLLDEPDNFLDLRSREALDKLIHEYPGTILFVSHDRRFLENTADRIITFRDKQLHTFEGGYSDYLDELEQRERRSGHIRQEELLLIQNELSEIIGRLSDPMIIPSEYKALDERYHLLLQRMKSMPQ